MIGFSLLRQKGCAVLAHAYAMSIAMGGNLNPSVFFLYGKICTAQPQLFPHLSAGKYLFSQPYFRNISGIGAAKDMYLCTSQFFFQFLF